MMTRIRSPKEHKSFQAFVEALLTTGSDADILEQLGNLEVPPPYRVRVKVLYSPDSPQRVISHLAHSGRLKQLSPKRSTFLVEDTIGRDLPRRVRAPFFLTRVKSSEATSRVCALIGVSNSDQWTILTRFTRHQYPKLVPVLLSQSELIRSARRLMNFTGHEVHVRGFSAKERIEGKDRRRSVREWTDERLEQALLDIQDRQQTLMSLDVDFFPRIGELRHVRPRASCKIRKSGEIEVSGSFRLAFDAVATEVAVAGEKKLQFLSGRGMRQALYRPRALAINFRRPVFEQVAAVRSLVGLLAAYPSSMHAVEHGNPYAHLQVTDLFDGSAFDIWAIPPSRLALIPGLKATEAAFERLVHFIFDRFREGELADYGPIS